MAQPATPSMLEFMDAACIRLVREVGGADIADAGALLMIEADGDDGTLPPVVDALERAARGHGLGELASAPAPAPPPALWAARNHYESRRGEHEAMSTGQILSSRRHLKN